MNIDAARAADDPRSEPAQHEVVWTPDRIRRFWDYQGSRSSLEDTYFSKLRGGAIVDFVSRRIRIGRALDMGCGRGDLIGHLLNRHEALGADQSPDSVATVNQRFGPHPRFSGATVGTGDLPDQAADTIFMIEVVEHLDDDMLARLLTEARRLLRPGGHLVLTTPNDENLEASKLMCPECACIFHHWQHVRSWTPLSLAEHARRFGFQGMATPTLLSPYHGVKRLLNKAVYRVRGDRLPHMVYIGSQT